MKQINSKIKVSMAIIAIIIITGIGMIIAKGMNKSILYSEHTRLEITLNDLDKEKVETAITEVFGTEIAMQTIGNFEDIISISVKNLEEEKKTELQEKINALNENNEVEIKQTEVGRIELKSIVISYILPMAIVTLIFAIYKGIKYRKKGFMKHLIIPIISVGVVEVIYVSIFAIFQIPVGNDFMPLAAIIGIMTLIVREILYKGKSNIEK